MIEDTPLVCKLNSPLSHLSEVSFSRRQFVLSVGMPPSFSWKIKNGTKATLRIQSTINIIQNEGLEIYSETFSFITNERGLE